MIRLIGLVTTGTYSHLDTFPSEIISLGLQQKTCYRSKQSKCHHLSFKKINSKQVLLMLDISYQLHQSHKIVAFSKLSLSLYKLITLISAKNLIFPYFYFIMSSIAAKEQSKQLNLNKSFPKSFGALSGAAIEQTLSLYWHRINQVFKKLL